MELVTRKEAAKKAFVTPNLITHWVRRGRINAYPITEELRGGNRKYLVSMEEVKLAHKLHDWGRAKIDNPELISTKEASEKFGVKVGTIFSWIRRYGIKKYYLPNHNRFFLINPEDIINARQSEFK